MITKREGKELLLAWLATSVAFGILLWTEQQTLLFSILVAAFTVGIGFICHELAHRYAAFKFRKHAEFESNKMMLVLAILMSFFGFILAAPGYVRIAGMVNRHEVGIISIVGPAANLVVAILFLPFIWIFPSFAPIAFYGFMINSMMGLFNLIPAPGFDGEKIIVWSKPAYFAIGAVAIILNILNILLQNFLNTL